MAIRYFGDVGRVAGLKPEETRQRVIDGAAEVFAEHGFERARVTDIAKAAGLSSGAMYKHFASKADLLAAVVECHAAHQLTNLLLSGEVSGLLDAVLARGKQLTGQTVEGPLLIEVIASARRDPDVLRVLTEQVGNREGLFVRAIELAQEAGEVTTEVDARAVSRFLLVVLLGSLLLQTIDLPDLDSDHWGALLSRLIDSLRQENPQ